MRNFPIDKYKFYYATKTDGTPYKVIATSTYCGRPVRGSAKCSSLDTFDVNVGQQIAAARCNQKVALKRKKRAEEEFSKAVAAHTKAKRHLEKMTQYYMDAQQAVNNANYSLSNLLERY